MATIITVTRELNVKVNVVVVMWKERIKKQKKKNRKQQQRQTCWHDDGRVNT